MPKLTKALPRYAKHKASNQAIVTIDGQLYYLGPYGTKASRVAYDQLVMQWLANGRTMPEESGSLTLTELCVKYFEFCQGYYVKNGRQTDEVNTIRYAIRKARELFGDLEISQFSPKKLAAVRESMVQAGWCRTHINKQVDRIRRMFRWAVAEELLSAEVYANLKALPGLKIGRTEARESNAVEPVAIETVKATLPFMLQIPADMVRIQLLTGARPSEICNMRPCDIDREYDVWIYTPNEHKTQHQGKKRTIFVGPEAQAILSPYLDRPSASFCFSPAEAVEEQRRQKRDERKRPLKYEYRKPKKSPKRQAASQYNVASYRRAIHRACDKAFRPSEQLSKDELRAWQSRHRWSPNRLRHTAATEIRKQFGLDGAQIVLGHSSADVTQIYAELDIERGFEIARKLG